MGRHIFCIEIRDHRQSGPMRRKGRFSDLKAPKWSFGAAPRHVRRRKPFDGDKIRLDTLIHLGVCNLFGGLRQQLA